MFSPHDNQGKKVLRASLVLVFAGLVLLSSCAPTRIEVAEEIPTTPEAIQAAERLKKADRLVEQHAYLEAMTIYENYLKQFPQGPQADETLIKIGRLHMRLDHYMQARQALQRLIGEHPSSPLISEARFNLILSYYKEEKFVDAVAQARAALESATTTHQKTRIHTLMGHSYSANRQFREAVVSYMDAYRLAPDREREEILGAVRAVIPSLDEADLYALIENYGDKVPGGYLRLQLARVYDAQDRIDEALGVLSEFLYLFPDHEASGHGAALAQELKSRALVDRFSVGCILPLSGPYENFGQRALSGIELALSEFNAQDNVSPIQLLVRDSQGDFSQSVSAIEKLALYDEVIGIIGPMISSESAAARAQTLGVPVVTLTQKPEITQLGDYVFRNFLTPSLQVRALVNYTVEELGIRRFAILYPDERYGISFMNAFWDEVILHGAEVTAIECYGLEQTDFADAIKKLVGLYYPRPENVPREEIGEEADALEQVPDTEDDEPAPIVDFDAVFIPDTHEKIALIAPQFPYYDVTGVLFLGTNLWHSNELIKSARNYVQGAIVPEGFFADSKTPRVRDFVNRYQEVFGTPPGMLEAQAYDAARILFQVMNDHGVRSRQGLRTALLKVRDFPGVTGLTSFDETGDVDKQIYLLKIRGAHFVEIKPLP